MATRLYARGAISDYGTGNNDLNLRGTAIQWDNRSLALTRGTVAAVGQISTVVGPTAGIEYATTGPSMFYSPPLAAAVTISGSIQFNIWGFENAATINAAANAEIAVVDGATGAVTVIHKSTNTTELALTTSAVNNFSQTPAAGVTCKKGDRLRVRLFVIDSAAATMAAGSGASSIVIDGPTAGASGDTYLEFTENFSFVAEPAGTQVFLTDTPSITVGAAATREAWKNRGGGVATATTNTVAGWTAPIQITNTAGGTALEWYTNPLQAMTLGDAVRVNLRARESSSAANAVQRCELAVVNGDGSSPVVWALGGKTTPELSTAEAAVSFLLSGADKAITAGQRIRIRLFIDDVQESGNLQMAAGQTVTTYFAGAAGATGDTYLTFAQTLTATTTAQTLGPPLLAGATTLYAPVLAIETKPVGALVPDFTQNAVQQNWTRWFTGTGYTKLNGSLGLYNGKGLGLTRVSGASVTSTPTVAGPTNGVELENGGGVMVYMTLPLAAGVTIAGAIQFNVWAHATAAAASAAINVRLLRLRPDGSVTEIHKTVRTTALTNTTALNNWSETPASVALLKGDRIALVFFADDAVTMTVSNFFVTTNGLNAGLTGDTWVKFAETLSFIGTTAPAGTKTYLLDAAASAGINPGAALEKDMATTRGSSTVTLPTTVPTGPTAPVQATASAGGTAVEWYTRPLVATTLVQPVELFSRALSSVGLQGTIVRAELAIVDGDGTNAVVWATAGGGTQGGFSFQLSTTDSYLPIWLFGPDTAIADGKRLRLRLFFDDSYERQADSATTLASTSTISYNGPSASAAGDSYLVFNQTLTEFAPPVLQAITVPLLTSTSAVYAPSATALIPTLVYGVWSTTWTNLFSSFQVVGLEHLFVTTTLYAPTVIQDKFVTVPQLDAEPELTAPTVMQDQFLTVPLLTSTSALYPPVVPPPSQRLTVGLISVTATQYALTLVPQPVLVGLPHLLSADATYAPALVPHDLEWGGWSTTYSNIVSGAATILPPLLDAGPSLTSPAVVPAPRTLSPALLTSTSAIYTPTFLQAQFLTVTLLTSTSALYSPTVLAGQTMSFSLIDAANALYAPVLYQDQFVVPPLVDSGFALYPTTVAPGPRTFSLSLLDAAATLSAPAVTPVGGVTQGLTLPTIDASGGAGFSPNSITGLSVWLDPSQLGLTDGAVISSFPNLGTGADPTIVPRDSGSYPQLTFKTAQTPTGLPAARFGFFGDRLRGAWPTDVNDFTLVYLVRAIGPNVGRAFGAQYPPSNFLIGFHTSYPDAAYDNGTWLGAGTGWNMWSSSWPGPWRMYGGDSASGGGFRFFVDGAQVGDTQAVDGDLTVGWAMSGYEATGGGETMDMDVAEMVLYDRKLSDVERASVETYLQQKWITGGAAPSNLFSPGFVQTSPAQTVTLGLLGGAPALYVPAVVQTVAAPLLTSTSVLSAPTVAVTVGAPLLTSASSLTAPLLYLDQFVTVPLLTSTATLTSPTLLPQPVLLTVPLLTSTSSLTAPLLYQDQFLTAPLLTEVSTLTSPLLTVGPVTVTLGLLDAIADVYVPAVTRVGGGLQAVTLPFIGGISSPSYAARIASLAPVSHWRLGEPSGTVAVDQTAFHDAAYTASPTLGVAGALTNDADTAMQVAGVTNQGADAGNGVGYQLDVLTVEAWVRTSGSGSSYRSIIVKQLAYGLFAVDGVVTDYEWAGGGAQTSGVNIADGVRHHIVAALAAAAGGSQIYVDGAAAGAPFTHTTSNHSTSLNIGYNAAGGQEFIGVIDEVAIYSRVLTPAEVAGNYEAGITGAVLGTELFAPGFVQLAGAQVISLGLIDAGSALYAPTVYLDQFVTLPLVDAGATLSPPTVIQDQFVTIPLTDAAAAVYAPAVQPDQFVTVPLLDAGRTISAPALAVGAVGLTIPLVDAGAVLTSPALYQVQSVTLLSVDAGAELTAPVLEPNDIEWTEWSDVYSNLVEGAATVTLPFLDAGPALFAPSLIPGPVSFAVPLLSAIGAAPFSPTTITGLAVWLDASTLAGTSVSTVPNIAPGGLAPTVIGTPSIAVVPAGLNGLPVVHFAYNSGGHLRFTGTGINQNWTVAFVARLTGPNAGRVVTAILPPNNLLIGFWNGNQDVMYDAGFADNSYLPWTTNWKLYSADGTTTGPRSRLFSDGVYLGQVLTSQGWAGTLGITGYSPTDTSVESADADVAEFVMYDRPLSDAERDQVEDYLRLKWFGVGTPTGEVPLYAPSFVQFSAPQTISVPLIDAGPALYAPAVLQTQTVSAPLLTEVNAVYAPSVMPAQFVTVPLVTSTAVLSAPTLLVQPVTVTVPLLTSVSSLSPPALLPQPVSLTIPQLVSVSGLYAPAVLVQPITFVVPLLTSTAAVHAPALTPFVVAPLITSVSAVYAPAILIQPVTVSIPLLDAGATVFSIGINLVGGVAQSLTLPALLPAGGAAWSPVAISGLVAWLDATQDSFTDGQEIETYTEHSPAHTVFAQSGALSGPIYRASVGGMPRIEFGNTNALGIANWIVPPAGLTFVMVLRSAGFASYDMFITSQGGGPGRGYEMRSNGGTNQIQIVLDYSGYGIVFTNPYAFAMNADHVFVLRAEPTVGAESWVDGNYQQGGALGTMTGLSGPLWFGRRDDGYYLNAHVGEGLVFGDAISDPDLASLTAYLNYKWLGTGSPPPPVLEQLFAPGVAQLAPAQAITLGLLDGGATTYAPTVEQDQFVTLGLVDTFPNVYMPALVYGQSVTTPVIDAGPALTPPTLVIGSLQSVTLPLLTSAASLSPPTIAITTTVAATYWTTPADNVPVVASPTFYWLIPAAIQPMHFEMQLDTDPSFDDPTILYSSVDQTGWEYFNFSAWVPVPAEGVPPAFAGNEARHTLQTPLTGPVYRRVRAGIRIG